MSEYDTSMMLDVRSCTSIDAQISKDRKKWQCSWRKKNNVKYRNLHDDDLIAHQIESVLHNIGDEENVKIDTDVFYSGNDLVREISSGKKFDLIYMDIQMENGDGITAAKNIRKKDEDAMIIFISSYDRYVMELFRLDVFSFISKTDRPGFVTHRYF